MVFRRRREPEPGPPPLPDIGRRWRDEVEAARGDRDRFSAVVERTPAGPVRDRLGALAADVDAVVAAVEEAAIRADRLEATLGDLDPQRLTDELKDARRELARAEDDGRDTTDALMRAESLDRQLGSVHEVWDRVDGAAGDLHRLRLRLGEYVALAGVVATHPVTRAEHEVVDLRDDLRALQQALDELAAS